MNYKKGKGSHNLWTELMKWEGFYAQPTGAFFSQFMITNDNNLQTIVVSK